MAGKQRAGGEFCFFDFGETAVSCLYTTEKCNNRHFCTTIQSQKVLQSSTDEENDL
jgi:hypothetical protein